MKAQEIISVIREKLNTYEELGIKGMTIGESAWHQGRVSLVVDLRNYLGQLELSLEQDGMVPVPKARPTCRERFYAIIGMVSRGKDGFNPFQLRERGRVAVCWRQAVWRMLAREGYHTTEIGRVSGYDHATVWWGIRRLDNYIETGDLLAINTWNDLYILTK